jgi:DNA-binding transcriptional LysR family regulator
VFARAGHPLAGRRLELTEIVDQPWALPPSSQRWRQQFDEYFFAHGLSPPKPAIVSNSATYLKALMLSGDYLSFLPAQLVAGGGELLLLDVPLPAFTPDISLTYKERTLLNPACSEVADVLREVASTLRADAPATLTKAA